MVPEQDVPPRTVGRSLVRPNLAPAKPFSPSTLTLTPEALQRAERGVAFLGMLQLWLPTS